MTYNTARRKPLSKKQRPIFLASHGGICWWCRQPINTDEWDDEHKIARELLPGAEADDMSNRAPIHRNPCHKQKTALDRKLIAKSNRIRRAQGPIELRRKTKPIMRPAKTTWAKRPFERRAK